MGQTMAPVLQTLTGHLNTLIFWARWQNVLHRLKFKSNKKNDGLSKGQNHLEIIL